MDHEMEVMHGLLGKHSRFRLIVKGTLGVKEIDRLIEKLEIDKAILAEADSPKIEGDLITPGNGLDNARGTNG